MAKKDSEGGSAVEGVAEGPKNLANEEEIPALADLRLHFATLHSELSLSKAKECQARANSYSDRL